MDRIDQLLESYQDEMVQTLRELVRIPSVDGEPKRGNALWRKLRQGAGLCAEKRPKASALKP